MHDRHRTVASRTCRPTVRRRRHKIGLDASYVCNNDKALSQDGKMLAFSATKTGSSRSQVFVADQDGSHVRLVVPEIPSYFLGWSPDGQWLAFVSKRDPNFDSPD